MSEKANRRERKQPRVFTQAIGTRTQRAVLDSDQQWLRQHWYAAARVRPYRVGELPCPLPTRPECQETWRRAQAHPDEFVTFVVRMQLIGEREQVFTERVATRVLAVDLDADTSIQARFLVSRATYQDDVAALVGALGLPHGVAIAAWEVEGVA